MVEPSLFGPIDAVFGATVVDSVLVIEAALFALVIVNFVTRRIAWGRHKRQADDDADAVTRWPLHELTNVLLVLGAFYYTTLDHHPGVVLSTLVLGLFITDFFEFEARKVEARREIPIEQPKGSLVAGVLVLLYAGYQAVFFLLAPLWGAVV
jgi:hypothetical protein